MVCESQLNKAVKKKICRFLPQIISFGLLALYTTYMLMTSKG